MRIALILITLLASCNSSRNINKQLNQNFKLETVRTILLDSANELFNSELLISDISNLTPPVLGEHYSELPFLMDALNEPDSAYIMEQFRERKNFNRTSLESDRVQVLSISKLTQDSFWQLLESDSIEGFYSIGMPIFNKELTKMYFRFGYLCGQLCGSEESYIFERTAETNNWIITKNLESSVY